MAAETAAREPPEEAGLSVEPDEPGAATETGHPFALAELPFGLAESARSLVADRTPSEPARPSPHR